MCKSLLKYFNSQLNTDKTSGRDFYRYKKADSYTIMSMYNVKKYTFNRKRPQRLEPKALGPKLKRSMPLNVKGRKMLPTENEGEK